MRGRPLRRVEGPSPRLDLESEQDRSSYVREQVQRRLEQVLTETERNIDTERALDDIQAVVEEGNRKPSTSFSTFANKLAVLLRPKPVDPVLTPGSWAHYLCASHHR